MYNRDINDVLVDSMYLTDRMMIVILTERGKMEQKFLDTNPKNSAFGILNENYHFQIKIIHRKKVNIVIMEL